MADRDSDAESTAGSRPSSNLSPWQLLGAVAPDRLTEARLQLHWAIQAATGVGKALLEPADDDSHEAFYWLPQQRCFAQSVVPAPQPFRVAVDPSRLAFLLLSEQGDVISELPLGGMPLNDARAWLEAEVTFLFGGSLPQPLAEPADLGDHPLRRGAPFRHRETRAFLELTHFYENLHHVFSATVAQRPGASPIRLWPHHLDLAVLISLGDDRSVGVGLTPGDDAYDQPYLYVTPWPYPDADDLPEPPRPGSWHTDGWTGLVLRGQTIVQPSSRVGQQGQLKKFLEAAVTLGHELLAK